MSKVLAFFKDVLHISFGLVLLAFLILEFDDLRQAAQKMLKRAESVTAIELIGVKIDLDPATVSKTFQLYNENLDKELRSYNVTDAAVSKVMEVIPSLSSEEFSRLMYVGQLKDLCEFENPTTKMRNDVALDFKLKDKGVTDIEISPAALESVRKKIEWIATQGKPPEIGYPRLCYEMNLSGLGANVKTALVGVLSRAFNSGAFGNASVAAK